MRSILHPVLWLVCLLPLTLTTSCGSEAAEVTPPVATDDHGHSHEHTYDVACGCTLAEAGHKCGNFVKVDGKFIPLAGDIKLGEMEFCGKKGLMAELEGEVKDGKFVATKFAYHEH